MEGGRAGGSGQGCRVKGKERERGISGSTERNFNTLGH